MLLSADEYCRSDRGRALPEERNRSADNAIRAQGHCEAQGAAEFFLAKNRDDARTNDNRDQILRWLKGRNMAITRNTPQEAFDALKHQRALSPDNHAEYGATRVIDMSDLGTTNPMHNRLEPQHVELSSKVRQENHYGRCSENVESAV